MRRLSIIAWVACITVAALLLRHLWTRPDGSVRKRKLWSLVVCVPVIGWILYAVLYDPPRRNTVRARGGASGWGYWGSA